MAILTAFFSMKGETIAPGMKIVNLVKGHTAVVAETIQAAVGGDLFEMETVKTYNPDHMKMIYEAQDELKQGIRPELKAYSENLDQYDTVFLCYPNWWNTLPMPVLGFIERYDWTGKRVLVFATSGGSDIGKTMIKLAPYLQGADIAGGKVVKNFAELKEWTEKVL